MLLTLWVYYLYLPAGGFGPSAGEVVRLEASGHLELLAVDLDVDGAIDLVALNRDAATVEILMNDRRGSFVSTTKFATEERPESLAAGRLNDDEFVDLLAVSFGSFVTAFGDGTGRFPFAPPARHPSGSHHLVFDLDGDGRLDQVLRGSRGTAELYVPVIADGSTPLNSPVADPRVFAAGDLDGDGNEDLVVWGQAAAPHLAVFEGRDGGGLEEPLLIERTPGPGGELVGAVAGDFDADSKDEVLLLARGDFRGRVLGFLYVLERLEDGEYAAWRLGSELRLTARDQVMTAVDLDGDLAADLVLRGMRSDSEEGYWVLRSAPGNGIGFGDVGFLHPPATSTSLTAGDFDADGVVDLAVGLSERGEVEVLSSPLESEVAWRSSESCHALRERFTQPGVTHVVTAFVPSLRRDAILWAGGGAAGALVLEAGRLREVARLEAPGTVGSLAAGDADGDTDIDVVLTDPGGKAVLFYLLDGDLHPVEVVRMVTDSEPRGVAIQASDRDEGWRAAVTYPLENRVGLVSRTEGGGFTEVTWLPAGRNPTRIVSGDVNADSATDLAVLNLGSGDVSVLLATGRGEFGPPVAARVLDDPVDLAMRDLDGDDRDDIVVASRRTNGLTLITSQDGSLSPRFFALPHGSLPTSIALEDLDGNGEIEAVLANSGSGAVMVVERDASGDLVRDRIIISRFARVLPGSVAMAVGDLVGNGWKDIVVSDEAAGEVRIYVSIGCGREALFRRGDADGSGAMALNDAGTVLRYLFSDGELACPDAGDVNDDGTINLADAVGALNYLFSSGETPRPPGPLACGRDPTGDELSACRAPCFEE